MRRVQAAAAPLEFTLDQLALGVHRLAQLRGTADAVAERVLQLAAARLEQRERLARQRAGTDDVPIQEVLRSLAQIQQQ